ncbi:MAG TPA: hypothetical protein VH087_13015 [Thermoanaerobaculia bacterium]|jgi:hypothetical protein|nr:hypothetical protein [Thermoanaerobaculia bacterium]
MNRPGTALALFLLAACRSAAPHPGAPGAVATSYPGGALIDERTLSVAVPIVNTGTKTLSCVTVTGVSVKGGALLYSSLPQSIRDLKAGDRAVVFATFRGRFAPEKTYTVSLEGSAGTNDPFAAKQELRLPPRSPGEATAHDGTATSHKVSGGKYPPQKPNIPPEMNQSPKWAIPMGPYHPPTRSVETKLEHAQLGDPPGIVFDRNQALGVSSDLINEPSGAAGGGIVFVSAGVVAGYSDAGNAFTTLDPTTIFPNDLGGFCCDQIVQYAPSIDRMIWYLQYGAGARIAAASPADIRSSHGTAWTYWDIPAASLGFGDFDFPDLSVGDHFLYASTNAGRGFLVMRLPLDEVRDGAPALHFSYSDPKDCTMAFFGHLAQNAHDEIFWAGHNTNSSIRVFSWQESAQKYSWRDVNVASWSNDVAKMKSPQPDGQDWLSMLRVDNVCFIAGATRVLGGPSRVNQVWLGWSAASDNDFPTPHIELAALDRANNFALVAQGQIWNSGYAFAYPAFTSSNDGELAMAFEYGGGKEWGQFAVGFWGDDAAWTLTDSDAGTTRFGDYVTIRPSAGDVHRYDAFGFGISSHSGADTHYVTFGRP